MPSIKNIYPYKAFYSQFCYLKNLLADAGFTKTLIDGKESLVVASYRAYCFIFHHYTERFKILDRDKDGWLQLQMDVLNTRFEGWKREELMEAGLLKVRASYIVGKESFKYRIPEHILEGWVAARDIESGYYNYFSGKPWTDKDEAALWSELEKTWEGYPVRMKQAADSLQKSFFNLLAVEKHLADLRNAFSKLSSDDSTYQAKKGELLNDELCFNALLVMSPSPPNTEGICSFKPRYQPATTGRINMLGGALQSCTREMKYAAYGSLEKVGMRNYDLSSSQARILLYQEFDKYSIECPWLEEYLASKEKRKAYAEQIGIPDRVWKTCLSALFMGAGLPTSATNYKNPLVKSLKKELGEDMVKLQHTIRQLRLVVKPLVIALDNWHTQLMQEIENSDSLVNLIGTEIKFENLPKDKPHKKIAAHILQGTEAYFIQELTILAPKYGYRPIANEHDGLVVIGEISKQAGGEARTITGLDFMKLEEKPDFGANKEVL
jgi:hypothetical protein